MDDLLHPEYYLLQSVHFDEGTHRFEDPVSKITLKDWGGVPIPMIP